MKQTEELQKTPSVEYMTSSVLTQAPTRLFFSAPHSVVDLITNSSSELFIFRADDGEQQLRDALKEVTRDNYRFIEHNLVRINPNGLDKYNLPQNVKDVFTYDSGGYNVPGLINYLENDETWDGNTWAIEDDPDIQYSSMAGQYMLVLDDGNVPYEVFEDLHLLANHHEHWR